MKFHRCTLSLLVGLIAQPAIAQSTPKSSIVPVTASTSARSSKLTLEVPFDQIDSAYRDRVIKVIRQPMLSAHGPMEEFNEGIYPWLLEHPDRASLAWRRLGIPCSEITRQGQGRFGWTDGQGTEVSWCTVYQDETKLVWYAEGHTKLGAMLSNVPVRCVVVLSHPVYGSNGKRVIRQETDVYLQTDSKAASLIGRAIGPTMPRLAEQGASQLLLFFSGLTRYFERHPEDIATLLASE